VSEAESNVLVVSSGDVVGGGRRSVAGTSPAGQESEMEAHRSHSEEAGDLSRSLRWSTEQLEADHAAKLLLAAEEGLVAAHTAALVATPAAVAIEQRALDKMNATCEMEDYLAAVRTAVERRQQELASLEAAVCLYEQRCVGEEAARRYVKRPVSLPWA